jgi:F-type H+-transporting ATPase subunit b
MKSWRVGVAVIGTVFMAFLLTSLPVLAADASEPDPADSPAGLIFRWLNFLIVFGGIGYLIAKHGGAFFSSNAKEISASIHEAAAEKAQADHELRDVESKVATLPQEISELHASARRDSTAEAQRLRASEQVEIEKIKQAARGELDASVRAAQQELRGMAASVAVERAGVIVKSRMNSEIRARLLHSFLKDLGRSKN